MAETPVSLLDRLRRTASEADWRRLVDLYTPLLRRWLARTGLQASDQDDLVQEVLTAVVRELPHFRHTGQRGAFRRWLRTILAHRVRYFWRQQQRRPLVGDAFEQTLASLEQPGSELSKQWDAEHDQYVVARLLEVLRPEFEPGTWRAFQRYVLDGQPVGQVAAELGMTANAVCIAKSRVRRRLREEGRGLLD
jgi:RNA polymerase sigma-70 factor (ECF subfamily)